MLPRWATAQMARTVTYTAAVVIGLFAVGVWTGVSISPANAAQSVRDLSPFTTPFEKANPPKGWNAFCLRYMSECVNETISHPRKVRLTEASMRAIVRVNDWVNSEIHPMTDRQHWGTINKWVYPDDGYGDCKDYTLLKRRLLMEMGYPREALLVTIVWTKENHGHAVLIVRTNKGDYVLDNLTRKVLLWTQTTHDYVERQSTKNTARWVYIDGYLQDHDGG